MPQKSGALGNGSHKKILTLSKAYAKYVCDTGGKTLSVNGIGYDGPGCDAGSSTKLHHGAELGIDVWR